MKKLTLFTIFLFFPLTVNVAPKKFKVTFTITFNELSLQQVADKEEEIRERFENACVIDVELAGVESSSTGTVTLSDSIDVTPSGSLYFEYLCLTCGTSYTGNSHECDDNTSTLEYTGDVYCTACGEIYTSSGHICKEKE